MVPSNLDRFYKIGGLSFPFRDASVFPPFVSHMSSFSFTKTLAKEMILYYESVTALFIVFGLKDQGASEPAQTSIYISLRTQLDLSTL